MTVPGRTADPIRIRKKTFGIEKPPKVWLLATVIRQVVKPGIATVMLVHPTGKPASYSPLAIV
jgi:hypothetical protein